MEIWCECKKMSEKKSGKQLSYPSLLMWAKEDNLEIYETAFPKTIIDWGRLTDLTFALSMEKLYFKGKVLFTGKDKELEGYYFNGTYWKQVGINNAEICKYYFQKLYEFYMHEFFKVKDEFDEDQQKGII